MSNAIENLNAAQQKAFKIRPKVVGFPYLVEVLRQGGSEMKKIFILSVIFLSTNAFAKRLPPAEVKPLVKDGIEYNFRVEQGSCDEPSKNCGMQVFLVSQDTKTGQVKWDRELYQKSFDPNLEVDVQTVFPKSLKFKGKEIVATDEMGSTFRLKLTGELISPLKSIIYSGAKK